VDHYLILSGDQLYRMDYQPIRWTHPHQQRALSLWSVGALPVDQARPKALGLDCR